jgi:hypothetical protein
MKHFLLLYSIILFVSCKNEQQKDKQSLNSNDSTEVENVVSTRTDQYISSIIIDEADAKLLAKGFNREIRGLGHRNRTSAVWFNKEVIKLLYDSLYSSNSKARLDGIRVYFGKYPSNAEENRRNKLTMFFLLTVPSKDGKSHDDTFFFKRPPTWNKENFANLNHGELCPEVCDDIYKLRDQY